MNLREHAVFCNPFFTVLLPSINRLKTYDCYQTRHSLFARNELQINSRGTRKTTEINIFLPCLLRFFRNRGVSEREINSVA